MSKFRSIKTLHKLASIHASIHNHSYFECHLNRSENFTAALAEWHQLAA
jgi:putative transposase